MFRFLSRVLLFLLVCAVLSLVAVNREIIAVAIPLSSYHITMPIYLVFFGAVLLGIIITSLYYTTEIWKLKLQLRKERQQLKAKQKEVDASKASQDFLQLR